MRVLSNRSFVLIVGDPKVVGRGWGGRHAGGACQAHGVCSTYAVEGARGNRSVGVRTGGQNG